jgi:hypothetical protein
MRRRAHSSLRIMNSTHLLTSLVVGCVGYVCFAYGRRQRQAPPLLVGVVLMVFPYFVDAAWLVALIAALLLGLLWLAHKLNWGR